MLYGELVRKVQKLKPFILNFIKFTLAVIVSAEFFILVGLDTGKLNIRDLEVSSIFPMLAFGLCFTVTVFLLNQIQSYLTSKYIK